MKSLILAILGSLSVFFLLWPRQDVRAFLLPTPPGQSYNLLQALQRRWKHRTPVIDAIRQQKFLNQLAALMRAGRTPAQMWSEIAQLNRADKSCPAALQESSNQAAFLSEQGNDPSPIFQTLWPPLAQCLKLSSQQGIPLAELLERYAHHVKADQELDELIRVESAGPKMTQKLLLILPLGGVGLGTLLGLDLWGIYVGHPLGLICVITGAILSVLAAKATSKVIKEAGQRL